MRHVYKHFETKDPILFAKSKKLPKLKPLEKIEPSEYFYRLCRTIIFQQLSGKAGSTIFSRFEKLVSGKLTPTSVLALPTETIRAAGVSGQKTSYLQSLAEAVDKNRLILEDLPQKSNQEVIGDLVQVKGIGTWTAEMFCMFSLGREDVFSYKDLGLRKGIQIVYGLKKLPSEKYMEKLSKRWNPYQTYAAVLLWDAVDTITP